MLPYHNSVAPPMDSDRLARAIVVVKAVEDIVTVLSLSGGAFSKPSVTLTYLFSDGFQLQFG